MNSIRTLEVYKNGEIIFSSTGKWLYPLFDLEDFLQETGLSSEELFIKDKIVGKASAMLICRLGFKKAEAGTLSKPAKMFFENYKIDFTFSNIVEAIDCKTEILLSTIDDCDEAYSILKERAGF